jgi:hypothetical protein
MLRGASIVGKSSSVRNLAQQFEYFIEINLMKILKTILSRMLTLLLISVNIQAITNILSIKLLKNGEMLLRFAMLFLAVLACVF